MFKFFAKLFEVFTEPTPDRRLTSSPSAQNLDATRAHHRDEPTRRPINQSIAPPRPSNETVRSNRGNSINYSVETPRLTSNNVTYNRVELTRPRTVSAVNRSVEPSRSSNQHFVNNSITPPVHNIHTATALSGSSSNQHFVNNSITPPVRNIRTATALSGFSSNQYHARHPLISPIPSNNNIGYSRVGNLDDAQPHRPRDRGTTSGAVSPRPSSHSNVPNRHSLISQSSIETPKPNMTKFIAHLIELVKKEQELDKKSNSALLRGTPTELEVKGVAILNLMVTGKF